jgi:hypothetical protein
LSKEESYSKEYKAKDFNLNNYCCCWGHHKKFKVAILISRKENFIWNLNLNECLVNSSIQIKNVPAPKIYEFFS